MSTDTRGYRDELILRRRGYSDGAAPAAPPDLQLLKKAELCEMLCVSEASIDRWLRSDPSFPQPRRIAPGTIRWRRSEVRAFLQGLPVVAYDDRAFEPEDSEGPAWG